jgi:hypothetical protein
MVAAVACFVVAVVIIVIGNDTRDSLAMTNGILRRHYSEYSILTEFLLRQNGD